MKFTTSAQWCLLRCWRELQNSKHMRCHLTTVQPLISSRVKHKKCQAGNQHISKGCDFSLGGYLTELFGALTNDTPGLLFPCVTVHWMLSLCFMPQVTWPGTLPSSTRFPATPHPSGLSKGLLGSLGDQAHLEPLVNKDPQAHQASPEMQACQGPQENEVSWAPSLRGTPLSWMQGSRTF